MTPFHRRRDAFGVRVGAAARYVGNGGLTAILAYLLILVLIVATALAIVHGPGTTYVAAALATLFTLGMWLTSRHRARALSVWLLLLVGVFNFSPALFNPINLADEPLWSKALKDGAVLAFLLVGTVVALTTPGRRAGSHLRNYSTALALMAGLMLADLALHRQAVLGALVSLRYYTVYPLVTLVVIRMALRRREITPLIKAIVLLGALESIVALLGFLGLVGNTYYQGYIALGGGSHSRAVGTLGNPNNLGLFLGLPASLLLSGAAFSSRMPRILLGGLIALGLVLSFSKSAALALALSVLLQRSFSTGTSARYFRVAIVGSLGIALAYVAVTSRATQLTPDAVFGTRVASIPAAWSEWTGTVQNFVVGHGFGFLVSPSQSGNAAPFVGDNMLLALALEGGIVAVLAFAAVVVAGLRLGAAALKGDQRSPVVAGLWGYMLFFLCYTPVAGNFRLFPGALLFWLAIGLLICWQADRPLIATSSMASGE